MISQKNTPSRLESHGAVPLLNPTTGIKMTFDSLHHSNEDVQLAPIKSSYNQKKVSKSHPVKDLPSQKRLKELFDYRDGQLYWKTRSASDFLKLWVCKAWNIRFSGKQAGCLHKRSQYVDVHFNAQQYRIHRLIWCWHYGDIASGMQIDHINGVRHDNRIENLRLATSSQNKYNVGIPKNNTTGHKGVFFESNKWRAKINILNRQKHLGMFENIEDAIAAYAKASAEIHKEFAHPSTKAYKRKIVQLELSVFQGGE